MSWLSINIVQCIKCRHWMMTYNGGYICINIICEYFGGVLFNVRRE